MNDEFVQVGQRSASERPRGFCWKCKQTRAVRPTMPPGCGPTGLCADCDDGQAPTWTSLTD